MGSPQGTHKIRPVLPVTPLLSSTQGIWLYFHLLVQCSEEHNYSSVVLALTAV